VVSFGPSLFQNPLEGAHTNSIKALGDGVST
jgi:hypothetical protein